MDYFLIFTLETIRVSGTVKVSAGDQLSVSRLTSKDKRKRPGPGPPRASPYLTPSRLGAGGWTQNSSEPGPCTLPLASAQPQSSAQSPFLVLTDHFIRVHFLSFLNISVIPLFLVFFSFLFSFFSGSSHYVLFCCISSFPVTFCTLQS